MDSITKYEIKAEAFRIMTGMMAPGKDSPAACGDSDMELRFKTWDTWNKDNQEIIRAFILSVDRILDYV